MATAQNKQRRMSLTHKIKTIFTGQSLSSQSQQSPISATITENTSPASSAPSPKALSTPTTLQQQLTHLQVSSDSANVKSKTTSSQSPALSATASTSTTTTTTTQQEFSVQKINSANSSTTNLFLNHHNTNPALVNMKSPALSSSSKNSTEIPALPMTSPTTASSTQKQQPTPVSSAVVTTPKSAPATTPSSVLKAHRFVMTDDVNHIHQLKSTRRQEKLGSMLRDILGTGKKVRDDAVSAIPDLGLNGKAGINLDQSDPLSLMSGLVSQIKKGEADAKHIVKNSSSLPLIEKYGKCQEVIGKGSYGTVRIAHKFDRDTQREVLYAVKEFKKKSQESESHFNKRLTSEFCISSSLHDINIIHTLDLMKDARGEYCQVMEYCDGGDLYSLILSSGDDGLKQNEADCFFKQLIRGVVYMHSMGVAHCDLKPENLLLTCSGVLKISDFGNAECFRMAWETEVHLSNGVCGSRPYIAPEQFREKEFDPRCADVWATGVIYMAMRTGSYMWQVAIPEEDTYYEQYLQGRKHKDGFEPIEGLRRSRCRNVIYSILDPVPGRRITAKQILNSEWVRSIVLCEAGERGY